MKTSTVIIIGLLAFLSGFLLNEFISRYTSHSTLSAQSAQSTQSAHDEAQEMFLRAVSKSIEEGYLTINHEKVEEMAEGK